jgi:hypothetical protein
MAYTKNQNRPGVRDKEYAAEFASKRPFLDTRPHCLDEPMDDVIEHHDGESVVERFNRELRAGHAGRNLGDE